MRNRWFHTPERHSPVLHEEKKVSWLELFYDLIFVAAFIQLGNGLSHHVSVEGFLSFAGIFVPLWVAWTGFTFYVNRFNVDDIPHRLLVILQMSTIGYGTMSPATGYGHVIVTLEAAVALLGVALATGLTFAKVSRPRARVLFSNVAVLTHDQGQKVLMFRVGNARGNEIVDATMKLTIRASMRPSGMKRNDE